MTETDILRCLTYDPLTGEFRRKAATRKHPEGSLAGHIGRNGYRYLLIEGRHRLAHRVVWFLETGRLPALIDHINRDKDDNRFSNLREASYAQNARNSKAHKDNKSGLKGVCWDRRRERWCAYICTNGKRQGLGRFARKVDAADAYQRAAIELHGDFAPRVVVEVRQIDLEGDG